MCLCVCVYVCHDIFPDDLAMKDWCHTNNILHRVLSFLIGYLGNMANYTIYQVAGIEHHLMASAYASYISMWVCGWKRIAPSRILIDRSRKNDNLRLLWWSRTNCKNDVQRWWSRTKCKKGLQIPAVTFIGRPTQLTIHLNVVIPTSLHLSLHS